MSELNMLKLYYAILYIPIHTCSVGFEQTASDYLQIFSCESFRPTAEPFTLQPVKPSRLKISGYFAGDAFTLALYRG